VAPSSPEVALPEGHTIHRLARHLAELFVDSPVRASALQDRFSVGAATLDGGTVLGTDAWGKHLFLRIAPLAPSVILDAAPAVPTTAPAVPTTAPVVPAAAVRPARPPVWLHVHLGLYGRFTIGPGTPPPASGQLRLRLESEGGWADLRGAITSELLDDDQRHALIRRLGEDPLRKNADPSRPWARISRSRVGIGALLMQQDVLAGVGNVYRAEILFRQGIGPHRMGQSLSADQWLALWSDLRVLMRAGVRAGRIVTTRPSDRPLGARGRLVKPENAHYVYRRAGLACRVCGKPVQAEPLAGRTLYWCPTEQPD
jgi:endonuclease-8